MTAVAAAVSASTIWQPVPLDAEFSPEVAALLLSDRGRRELSSLLRRRDEALRTKVRKHLLAIGWTIVSKCNAVMAPRIRYESPAHDGKTYCSLPDLIDALRNHNPPPPELVVQEDDDDDEPAGDGHNHPPPEDAIAEYLALMASHDRAKGPRADRLRASAKRHLQACGWTFWMKLKSNGREELRYRAPTGRSYISLHTACQAYVRDGGGAGSPSGDTPVNKEWKKRKFISELISDGQPDSGTMIEKCTTTIEKKKKTSTSPQAVVGADGTCQLIKRSTTTRTTTISKRKKKQQKPAGASSQQSRVLRPNCEAATACQRRARTLLSVLIDEDILVPRDKVTYREASNAAPAKDGLITGDGVRCTCCNRAFTVAEFEAHATRGSRTGRPWARLFLKDGRSLSQCLVELMRRDDDKHRNNRAGAGSGVRVKEACLDRDGDSVCSMCNEGGELLLCDHCPSAFHHGCLGLQAIPEAGDWFCPCCRCGVCGDSDLDPDTSRFTDKTIIYCEQCEREYHVGCVGDPPQVQGQGQAEGPWLCSPGCRRVFRHLQGLAGRSIPTSAEGVSLAILRCRRSSGPGALLHNDDEAMAEEHGKLRVALDVLHECFVPLVEPRTQSDLSADMVFNTESELRRLHFRGYYVVGLERGGELLTVGTLRVYGNKVAELPLVATRFAHRRQGLCHLLVREVDKMLCELGVERLVLPAVPELLQMWTGSSLGFKAMTQSDKLEIADHTILCFQGTTMCQKSLLLASQ